MQDFKYKSTFASAVKCVISEDKDILLAKASLYELRKSLPNLPEDNQAFMPLVFPAFVANRVNKNDDVIDTKSPLVAKPEASDDIIISFPVPLIWTWPDPIKLNIPEEPLEVVPKLKNFRI